MLAVIFWVIIVPHFFLLLYLAVTRLPRMLYRFLFKWKVVRGVRGGREFWGIDWY